MKKINNILTNKKFLFGTNILFILIIFLLVFKIVNVPNILVDKSTITHDQNSSFVLTNPILDCDINGQENNSIIFSKDLNEKVSELKKEHSLDLVSLYYRDLNNGPWIGINEKEVFSPASLLKVPVLMAFLHQAEDDHSILNKKVTVSDSDLNKNVNQNITFKDTLVVGNKYSLLEVAELMIKKSDNTAVSVLTKNMNLDYIEDVSKSVGVPYKDTSSEVNLMVKDYAGFFRVLYNSSYLSREMSEKALEILSKSEYRNGIVAGVPEGINVAHKFGERSIDTTNTQLHDCGVVYYPSQPYILCIMTRGSDFKSEESVIKELSNYIYNEIDKNSPKNL